MCLQYLKLPFSFAPTSPRNCAVLKSCQYLEWRRLKRGRRNCENSLQCSILEVRQEGRQVLSGLCCWCSNFTISFFVPPELAVRSCGIPSDLSRAPAGAVVVLCYPRLFSGTRRPCKTVPRVVMFCLPVRYLVLLRTRPIICVFLPMTNGPRASSNKQCTSCFWQ